MPSAKQSHSAPPVIRKNNEIRLRRLLRDVNKGILTQLDSYPGFSVFTGRRIPPPKSVLTAGAAAGRKLKLPSPMAFSH